MLHDVPLRVWLGLLGAFWFAAPKASTDIFAAHRRGVPWSEALPESIVMAVLSMIGGTTTSYVTTSFFMSRYHVQDTGTVAFTVGFLSALLRMLEPSRLRAFIMKVLSGGSA